MALAMDWCVCVGQDDAMNRPTPLEKKRTRKATRHMGVSGNSNTA